jgi:spore coat protein CotH
LAYLAAMAIVGNADHIKKNYYMYRDPESADDRWRFFPWDLELTFGHLSTEDNDVLDEDIFVDMSPEFTDFRNRLIEKIFYHPRFLVRYYGILDWILEQTFDRGFIAPRIEHAVCLGTPDILADSVKRADNDEYLERVAELHDYVDGRRAFLGH